MNCPGCGKPFDSPDSDARCSSCAESGAGDNRNAEPIRVDHTSLARASDESEYRTRCPTCGQGLLLVHRNQVTLRLQLGDMCTHCGQRFVYTDAEIAGEVIE